METTKAFTRNLHEKLNYIFEDGAQGNIESLDPKDIEYGENLFDVLVRDSILYTHDSYDRKCGSHKVDAIAYVNNVEVEDNNIIIQSTYWTKYCFISIDTNNKHAGWSRRNQSRGIPLTTNIEIIGDEEDATLVVDITSYGTLASIIIRVKDGCVMVEDDTGRVTDYVDYTFCVKHSLSSDKQLSSMLRDTIENTIIWICNAVKDTAFEMTGRTQLD